MKAFASKLLTAIGVIVVLAGFYAYNKYAPVLNGGTGYSAKNICSGHFISDFSSQTVIDEALKGASSLLSSISVEIDESKKVVDTNMYGAFPRRAVFTDGLGCTLLSKGQESLSHTIQSLPIAKPDPSIDWPHGSAKPNEMANISSIIEKAFVEVDATKPRNTKAIVVIHKGELIAEHYAEGVNSDTPLIGWSMTKSITGLLVGMLVKDEILDISKPANVPLWQTQAGDKRATITLDQLMRMSSGLKFDETYNIFSDVAHMLSNEENAGEYAASLPLEYEPDTHWSYSSGTTNIISLIVKNAVGGSLQDYYNFVQNRLFRPLNISTATMEIDAGGTYIGSSYSYLSARDWARLGQFALQNGRWKNSQLLPENWMTYSTTPTPTNDGNDYGAQFWLNHDPVDKDKQRAWPLLPTDTYNMSGYQGQSVVIIPSKDLVVVRLGFTPAGNTGVEQMIVDVLAELDSTI